MRNLFASILGKQPAAPVRVRPKSRRRSIALREASAPATPALPKYERLKDTLLDEHALRVQRWRTSMSGVAILAVGAKGQHVRLIEAPYPRGPVSAAVFCHEVGHHALGVGSIKPRCLEEHAAWMWALDAMHRFDVPVTKRVEDRVDRSLAYAVHKAKRAGLKQIPEQLRPYDRSRCH